MNNKLLIIILLLVAIIAGATVYFFVFRDSGKEENLPPEVFTYEPGDYFVANVKDSNRLLKVGVVIELNTDTIEETLKKDEYIIRDTILFKLRSLTEEDILSTDIQEKLRKELTDTLNSVLEIDNITTIYFNEFVMS